MKRAAAIVTNHAAVVPATPPSLPTELGIPAIVGCGDARNRPTATR